MKKTNLRHLRQKIYRKGWKLYIQTPTKKVNIAESQKHTLLTQKRKKLSTERYTKSLILLRIKIQELKVRDQAPSK